LGRGLRRLRHFADGGEALFCPEEGRSVVSATHFKRLVDEQYSPLFRFALTLAKSEADASDLTQQTFFIWASKSNQLRDSSKAKSWLFTTLYREFLNRHRHEVRFPQVELDEVGEEDISVLPNLNAIDSATVLQALNELEEPFRAVITLFYLEQFSYRDIADVLAIPVGTVMSRLSRGKAQLRQRLVSNEETTARRIVPIAGEARN
jgi:RNA polymerase sigma-70 factor (ECF subfamily)